MHELLSVLHNHGPAIKRNARRSKLDLDDIRQEFVVELLENPQALAQPLDQQRVRERVIKRARDRKTRRPTALPPSPPSVDSVLPLDYLIETEQRDALRLALSPLTAAEQLLLHAERGQLRRVASALQVSYAAARKRRERLLHRLRMLLLADHHQDSYIVNSVAETGFSLSTKGDVA